MKKFAFALLAVATALAIGPSASATSVNGAIDLFGGNTFNSTGIKFTPSTAGVSDATGTFAGLYFGGVQLDNITFSSPDKELFSAEFLSPSLKLTDVAFYITGAIDETEQLINHVWTLDITGTGYFTESGYSETPATFTLTSSGDCLSLFQIDADTTATPEPSSLLLLGTGLLGLALVAFQKAKPSVPVLHT